MPVISPLSSPQLDHLNGTEIPIPAGPQPRIPRRLTQDLETEGLLPVVTPPQSSLRQGWSFLDLYDDVFGIDQNEVPFDEDGDAFPLPSCISQNCSSSDSFDSSPQTGSESSGDTRVLQSHLMTPVPQETREREVLSETMELGNCTYDKLNSTVTKTNTTLTKLNISHSVFTCNVSSTPLNVKTAANITSDLITSEPVTPGFGRKSVLERGLPLDPIAPPTFANIDPKQLGKQQKQVCTSNKNDLTLPLELAIKQADSTVDLDNEQILDDIQVNPDNPLVLLKPHPPLVKEKMTLTPKRKNSTILREQKPSLPAPRQKQPHKSTLPVMADRPSQRGGSGPRLLHGMRQASSISTLPRRSSLLPTSMKSRSHERINTAVTSTTALKHKK